MPIVEFTYQITDLLPNGDRYFPGRPRGAGGMTQRPPPPPPRTEPSLVTQANPLPTARFTDEAGVRLEKPSRVPRPPTCWSFLLGCTDHDHPPVLRLAQIGCGDDKGRQGSFGVDSSSAVEQPAFPFYGQLTREGVEVTEKHDLPLSLSADADRAARLVDVGVKSTGSHPVDHGLGGFPLFTRRARDGDEVFKQSLRRPV